MIQLNNITKYYGEQVLFDDITFVLGSKERVGFVGRNGSGKSTLFKIIMGTETADSGEIKVPKGYKIGALDQHINFNKPTVLEECCQVLAEHEKYDHYKAEKILFGLGFKEEDMEKSPSIFSGGLPSSNKSHQGASKGAKPPALG